MKVIKGPKLFTETCYSCKCKLLYHKGDVYSELELYLGKYYPKNYIICPICKHKIILLS